MHYVTFAHLGWACLFVFNIKFYFWLILKAISHQNNSEINNPQAERNVTCTTYLKLVDSDIFL